MCSPSPPPAPDYAAAAQAQGTANADAARIQGRINNPNVVGPNGTQMVTWDGDTPTLTQTLSPQQQALLEGHNATALQLSNLAGQGATAAQGIVGKPVDFSGAPAEGSALYPTGTGVPIFNRNDPSLSAMPQASGAIRDQVIAAMLSRANPAINRQQEDTESKLVAAGIPRGSEAWNREQDALNRQRNDAQQQAELAGEQASNTAFGQDLASRQQGVGEQAQQFSQGGQESQLEQSQQGQQFGQQDALRRQAITEELARRQIPLNEITALMSGSQVSNPFSTPGYAQNTSVAPAPVFGAQQLAGRYSTDVYNANVGHSNATTGAIGSMASMAAMYFL